MGSPNIRDLLTAFGPSSEFFAISSGDGRIKNQTEFVDIAANDPTDAVIKPDRGHLSVDYTCMKCLDLWKKEEKKAWRLVNSFRSRQG